MRIFLLIALGPIAALTACAADAPAPRTQTAAREVNCIDADRIVARHPSGPREVTFELTGGRDDSNELDEACPPLEHASRFDILSIELYGSRLCRGDRFRVFDPSEARAVGIDAFPHCRLGRFVAIAHR